MAFMDHISSLIEKVAPPKSSKPLNPAGIGSGGHGMVPVDDDMIVSKPAIIFHSSQIFFNFLAMACFAAVASFQARWGVGPSGLSGFAIFVSIAGMLLSAFVLLVPVLYEKYDKFVRLARALREVRVGFILTGAGTTFSLLIAFITTISAWTQPGCKNAENDPHAEEKGEDFVKGLAGWCQTKKAGAIFFWLAFAFWTASLVLLILDWRSGKLRTHTPRDPPFKPPTNADDIEGTDDDDGYHHIPPARRTTLGDPGAYDNSDALGSPFADSHRYNAPGQTAYTPTATTPSIPVASRPSMDAYGAFSDPAPTGYGPTFTGPPVIPEPDLGPRVSRTMQYADPYAAVQAHTLGGQSPTSSAIPPGYDGYQNYR
ncbi:hypothetical protein AX16_002422 [Volvariella volvacea WC 439]|nr:hypothetical protein AX16_002422 [Volvariella volvacea WC 439]